MELFLIRHGETVDNVAGLLAGVRDSDLTNHGVEQTRRLGEHFAQHNVRFTHIFASPLSRALKTAEAVRDAQSKLSTAADGADSRENIIAIEQARDLMEQDFGHYEGKPFHARVDARKTGKDARREKHRLEPGFVDVESRESMMKRADNFLDMHIMPLVSGSSPPDKPLVVAVISHGMLLGNLWRRLLARMPPRSVLVEPAVTAAKGTVVLEHLGGWSNTGYLHVSFSRAAVVKADLPKDLSMSSTSEGPTRDLSRAVEHDAGTVPASPSASVVASSEVSSKLDTPSKLIDWSARIRAIDSKEHLIGLKRQRGGIGSSAHDKGQRKLDGFFKRQRPG